MPCYRGPLGPLGPLDPGVYVADHGTEKQKCYSCEAEGGGVQKCLTCGEPRFKYLTETIAIEAGATRACRGCRGAP